MRFFKFIVVEVWRCIQLSWRYRSFRIARVSSNAEACFRASELVSTMRGRYPSMVFHGPIGVMGRLVADGHFDDVFARNIEVRPLQNDEKEVPEHEER